MSPDPSDTFKSNNIENSEVTLPTQVLNGFSSDEDAPVDNILLQDGYQLLANEPHMSEVIDTTNLDGNDDTNEVNYTSLSEIMHNLELNGPTIIEDDLSNTPSFQQPDVETTIRTSSNHISHNAMASDVRHVNDESLSLWNNSNNSSTNNIVIDKQKEDVILSVMANFTLPPSAIPPWAKNLSDEDWNDKANINNIINSVRKNDSS